MFGPRYFGPYFGATYFGPSGTATVTPPGSGGGSGGGGSSGGSSSRRRGMRPFPARHYRTPVVHRARVETRDDGDPVDSWPGAGTELMCNASQSSPQNRFSQQVEESVTGWVLWFRLPDMVEAGVTIRRGDQLTLTPAYGDPVVLRAKADGTDFNALGVSVHVPCEAID